MNELIPDYIRLLVGYDVKIKNKVLKFVYQLQYKIKVTTKRFWIHQLKDLLVAGFWKLDSNC